MTKAKGSGIGGVRGGNARRDGGYGAQSLADLARTPSKSRAKPKDADRNVDVLCWCERRYLRVPLSVVNDGRTESCGLARCHGPE